MTGKDCGYKFDFAEFERINCHFEFYKKVLGGDLVIPDFSLFKQKYLKYFNEIKNDQTGKYSGGQVASIFPSLSKVNPDFFATSFCSL